MVGASRPVLYFSRFMHERIAFMLPVMLGGHSELDPPLPIPNRTVKRLRADDSVMTHAKVGHRQAIPMKTPSPIAKSARGIFTLSPYR